MSVCSGKVYAVGGHDGNEHLGSMEVFDPLTNKWMMKASMNTKRYMCSMLQVLVCDVDAEKHPVCPAFLGGFQTVPFLGISFPYFGALCCECITLLVFFGRAAFWSRDLFCPSYGCILVSRAFLLCPVNSLELMNWFCGVFALSKNEQDNCQHNMKDENNSQ